MPGGGNRIEGYEKELGVRILHRGLYFLLDFLCRGSNDREHDESSVFKSQESHCPRYAHLLSPPRSMLPVLPWTLIGNLVDEFCQHQICFFLPKNDFSRTNFETEHLNYDYSTNFC